MRRLAVLGLVLAGALALTVLGGLVGRTAGQPPGAPDQSSMDSQSDTSPDTPVDLLAQRITRAQDRLRRVPGDWVTWAGLGLAYLEHARVGSDPTAYPKAEQAVARSLEIRPEGNAEALAARGALANARHDFATARQDALEALRTNAFHAEAYAVLADAETQLGHPEAATAAVGRLVDLRPSLASYARAAYDLEQRGLTGEATDLLRRALATAVDRHDIAFCREQLGDLAWNAGEAETAATEYAAGLAALPTSVALQRGQARVAAARGQLAEAIEAYAALTRRAPIPGHLLEYVELLRAAERTADADRELRLAAAAHALFTGNGGTDGVTGAALAAAAGDPAGALREAQAEWSRRQHADVADALAWALHLSHRDSEAIEYARRAVGTGARSAGYAYHLGMIELALGNRAAAADQLDQALRINPTFSPMDAPAARRALAELRPA